ncbi:hypothetical protein GCM10027200_73950 [Lentzea nigeriaca]
MRIYESELACVANETGAHTDIETGGSLFGLWTDGGNPTILLATGPGPGAIRRATQFEQDVAAHQAMEKALIETFGVQAVGLWHSHHRLGLHELSGGDLHRTMRFASRTQRTRFCDVLCYFESSSRPAQVTVKPYVYVEASQGKRAPTEFIVLPGISPVRAALAVIEPCAKVFGRFDSPQGTGEKRTEHRLARSVETGSRNDEDAPGEPKRTIFSWGRSRKPQEGDSYVIGDLQRYITEHVEPALAGAPRGVTCELEPIERGDALRLTLLSVNLGEEHQLDLGWNGKAAVVVRHVVRQSGASGPADALQEGATPLLQHQVSQVFQRLDEFGRRR